MLYEVITPHVAAGRWDDRFVASPEDLARLRPPHGAPEREVLRKMLAALGPGEKPPPSAVFARVPVADVAEGVCLAALTSYDRAAPAAATASSGRVRPIHPIAPPPRSAGQLRPLRSDLSTPTAAPSAQASVSMWVSYNFV